MSENPNEKNTKATKNAANEKSGQQKKVRMIIIIAALLVVVLIVFFSAILPKIKQAQAYNQAVGLAEQKEYDLAAEIFENLGEYKDSHSMYTRMAADKLFDAGDYSGAASVYGVLDTKYRIHDAEYQEMYESAEDLLEAGQYAAAVEAFTTIIGYSDSEEMINAGITRRRKRHLPRTTLKRQRNIMSWQGNMPTARQSFRQSIIMKTV